MVPETVTSSDQPLVMHVVTRLNVGGATRNVLRLNQELPGSGFRSELVWGSESRDEGRIEPTTTNTHLRELKRSINPAIDFVAYRKLKRMMGERRPSVVHTHMAKAGTLGRLAARRARVPAIVHTFHGHVLDGYFPRPVREVFLAVERRMARYADALIAVSPQVRDELLDLRVGLPEQWHVMPLGLDLGPLLASSMGPPEGRARFGLPAEGHLVGIAGRLVPIKDLDCFVDAAARIVALRDDVTFVIAGDGELREQLERRAREVLGSRVIFLGWVTDLEALYAALDIVVLTSLHEGTPVALIEAGAMGRPAVATRVGGVPDVIADGVTGALVSPGEPDAVANEVARLLDDPDRARRFGEAARVKIAERFGGPGPIRFLADLYRELLSRH